MIIELSIERNGDQLEWIKRLGKKGGGQTAEETGRTDLNTDQPCGIMVSLMLATADGPKPGTVAISHDPRRGMGILTDQPVDGRVYLDAQGGTGITVLLPGTITGISDDYPMKRDDRHLLISRFAGEIKPRGIGAQTINPHNIAMSATMDGWVWMRWRASQGSPGRAWEYRPGTPWVMTMSVPKTLS